MSLDGDQTPKYNYIWLTYPMLVFTHKDNIHPDGDIQTNDSNIIYHYRCKHHNKNTKDCDIYEERPMMCRTFPDGGFCGYRKVRDPKVIEGRPDWFKTGLSQDEWQVLKESKKENNVITERLDNISGMLSRINSDEPTGDQPTLKETDNV